MSISYKDISQLSQKSSVAGTEKTGVSATEYITPAQIVSGKEATSNKVTSLSSSSTDTQYPSAKSVYDNIHPDYGSSQPAGGMLPNVLYKLGTLTGTVTISLATPSDASVENEYKFTFTAGSTAPTITWSNTITKWVGNCLDSNGQPTITADKFYEISILDGNAYIIEW